MSQQSAVKEGVITSLRKRIEYNKSEIRRHEEEIQRLLDDNEDTAKFLNEMESKCEK